MLLFGRILPGSTFLLASTSIPAVPSSRGFPRTSPFFSPFTAAAAAATDGCSAPPQEFCDSDHILYIGNLDWSVPPETYHKLFSDVIHNGTDKKQTRVGVLPTIQIKETSNRPRDRTKCHGGSATITFDSPVSALQGQKALQAFVGSQKKDFRIRWARTPIICIPAAAKPKLKKKSSQPLTAEQVQHRKERAESYARKRQRVAQKTDAILSTVLATTTSDDTAVVKSMLDAGQLDNSNGQSGSQSICLPVLDAPPLDWSVCPPGLDPLQGGGLVRNARGLRKQAAVEAFSFVVREALLDRPSTTGPQQWVADLGCGAGNLALPLAWQLYSIGYRVKGVDFNQQSLDRLVRRTKEAGVKVEALNLDLLRLIVEEDGSDIIDTGSSNEDNTCLEGCAAVVSLHACGAASDLSIAAAVRHSLPFAISPCCIGKINTSRTVKENKGKMSHLETPPPEPFKRRGAPKEIKYPRSSWLQNAVPLIEDFRLLASAADYGVNGSSDEIQELVRRQRCQSAKRIVEADRLEWARERGYCVRMLELPRIGPHYPKRELLLGAKEGSPAARRIQFLPTTTALSDNLLPI